MVSSNHVVKLEFVCKCVCVCHGHGAAEAGIGEMEAGKEGGTQGRMSRCEEPAVGREMFCCVIFWLVRVDDGGVDGSITLGQQPQGSAQAKPTSCPQGVCTEILMCPNGQIQKNS